MAADRATVNLGFTANMKNFQSLRVDVGFESDAKDGETPEELLERVFKFVDDHFEDKLKDVSATVSKHL